MLVADMSSNVLSREIDISKFGVIYAGAQKNLGPAGITLVIIRDDLIGHARQATPSIWNYATQRDADSMINTPTNLLRGISVHWFSNTFKQLAA